MSLIGTHRRFNDVRSYVGSWGVKRKCCERHQIDAPDPTATLAGLKCCSAAVSCHTQMVLSSIESTGRISQ
jgi:hypothetical protein